MPAAEGALAEGREIAGRYRVKRLLGKGGMGAVYEADHIALGRTVAIKVLLPQYSENAEVVARFMREARAAAAIGHPGIVEVFDLGSDGPLTFLAMERLAGEELYERIRRAHPLPYGFVARVGVELCDAIAAAHEHGIIHRDLKPQNVFLTTRGRQSDSVKVLDFGIAKLVEAERADAPITRTGQMFGTPLYMSPEQLVAKKDLDARADVYAIGAILYEALTGAPPFSAESFAELVFKISAEKPPAIASVRSDVPSVLVAIVEHAMEKNRDQRIGSARELGDALAAFADSSPGEPRDSGRSIPETNRPSPFEETMASGPTNVSAAAAFLSTRPPEPAPSAVAAETPGALVQTPFAAVSTPPPARTTTTQSRRGLVTGVAVTALLASFAIAAFVATRDGGEPAAPAALPASAPPRPAPDPTSAPTTETTTPAPRSSPPLPIDPPPRATIAFVTTPPGATIRAGGVVVCRPTPCSADLTGSEALITASLPGYVDTMKRLVAPFAPNAALALQRAGSRRPRSERAPIGLLPPDPDPGAPPPLREP